MHNGSSLRVAPCALPARSDDGGVSRRALLHGLAGLAGLGLSGAGGGAALAQSAVQQVIHGALGDGAAFSHTVVIDIARVLAKRPYVAPANDLPEPFASLPFDLYQGIRARPEALLWGGEARGFAVEPTHRGFVYGQNVQLFAVEDGRVRRLVYDRAQFDFGRVTPPPGIGDLGYSGVRLFAANGDGARSEIAQIQGASFFRAIARGQEFGATARGLTLKPADPRGEEFPAFRALWIERPIPGSGALVIHGLLDSESATGAVRLTFRPGDVTIVDVEQVLMPRVALDHVGIGAVTGTYLFGPQSRRLSDDLRPAMHEVQGLQMLTGRGEWIWRPLTNPETLQISVFSDETPKGFGLVQRERGFGFYEEDERRLDRRPSVWIEPLADWGPGAVQLLEIPSSSETSDNVLAYWRPRQPWAAGTEVSVAYRQYWGWSPPEAPPLATVTATRVGRGSAPRRRRFLVSFTGDGLADAGTLVEMRPSLSATPGTVQNLRVFPYPEWRTVRVAFEVETGSETLSELRLALDSGRGPLSETWLYRWTPGL